MKHLNKYILFLMALLAGSCSDPYNEDIDKSKVDYVLNPIPEKTELDDWLFENFTAPYNIQVKYRWDVSELEVNKTLVPVVPEKARTIMNVVRDAWITPYIQEAGETFLKIYSPKQFVLVGSPNFNPGGTITLGTAEGGRKIVLYTINEFDDTQRSMIKEQMHTVHHEFAHILHQNILYPSEFKEITKGSYTADWHNIPLAEAQSKGFITSYSMSAPDEDFVEIIATMLTEGKRGFDRIVCSIPNTEAQAIIRQKQQIVENYFIDAYKINFASLQQRTENAIDGYAPKSLLADLGFNPGQNFTGILVDPAQLPPFPSDFQSIYDAAVAGLAAVEGAGRVLDYVTIYFSGDGIALVEYTYHNTDNNQFTADLYYNVIVGAGDIFSLEFISQNENADVVASGLQPLIDYFEDQTFFLDWISQDTENCVYDLGGIYPQESPDAYSFGLLIN